ncbi:MAG: DNA topoisomerase 3 [Candidatus Ordinivivax streblomastigis]|uniref:DNA topoisomerase 3 n=1 Tax=Candidatus Ordinivivax streblomastigis TaxID=2540710 RepID=A0A5M8P461_9BACT|nr:MAG: DNA topoisomerase 3 [Candidatus Ordinivivax streblomastigis]
MEKGYIKIINEEGKAPSVEAQLVNNTVWIPKWEIARLFNCFNQKIEANLKSIFKFHLLWEDDVTYTYKYTDNERIRHRTPATRAAIIETLFARDYIKRKKKSLVPTDKGLSVYEIVKDKRISDVSMTGNWENALSQIEHGEMQSTTFRQAIEVYTRQITSEFLDTSISVSSENTCIFPKRKSSTFTAEIPQS